MSTLDIVNGQFLHTHTTSNSGDYSVLLSTENKFVDKNIGIKITTPSGTATANTASVNATLNTTDGSNSGVNIHSVLSTPNNNTVEPNDNSYYFAVDISGSGSSKVTAAGWFGTGALSAASTSSTRYFNIAAAAISGSSTNATATTTVAPGTVSISKQSTPSGVTNAASSAAVTTTAPSSGVYVAVKATAAANTTGTTSSISGSGTAIVDTAGYAPSTLTGSITVSGTATAKTSSKDSSITYVPITTTSLTKTTTSVSGTTATRGTASWGTGWITGGSISAATFANTATSGITYVDISDTTAAPILTNGVLYINKGYVDDISISLGKLIPDTITDNTYAPAEYIRSGYAAYGADGSVIAGTMPNITPTLAITLSTNTYFTEQSGSSGASFYITPSYTNSTAGYLAQHTSAQNGTIKYYKIISATFTGDGGNVVLNTDTSQTNSIYRTGSESYISVESSAPAANTNFVYVKVTGSGKAKANQAGWIESNGATATGSSAKYIKIAKYTGDYTTA